MYLNANTQTCLKSSNGGISLCPGGCVNLGKNCVWNRFEPLTQFRPHTCLTLLDFSQIGHVWRPGSARDLPSTGTQDTQVIRV